MIVHGYLSSNKIGPHRLYVEMANVLSRVGYCVLRIDLSGMGESDGDISNFEFCDHVSDVSLAVTKLMNYVGSKKVHYIGHCIGTCTALQSAIDNRAFVESLTLISPFMPTDENYIRLLNTEKSYLELKTTGITLRKGLVCKKSFIDAGYVIEKYPEFCKQSKINSFVYFSGNDEMVRLEESLTWAKDNNLRYKIISGAEHNFINPSARTNLFFELEHRFRLLNTKKSDNVESV
ncbi:MAG: alpha/beta hydrolase [Nitrososphaerota archaeon]|nr:alpha/beta hydrolase [Nitrososphaerota archaeon]